MPVAFVHGVPETPELWRPLFAALGRADVTALALPGFDGAPRPSSFAATKDAYANWLVGELEAVGEPVDVVGHDWGGGLVLRVASLRSDLLLSWVSDALSVFDEAYEWHQFAKVWQEPGAGERWVQDRLSTPPDEYAAQLVPVGVPREQAAEMAGWFDESMGAAILDLYRSALDVAGDWGRDLAAIDAPGLALHPTRDPFADERLVRRVAQELGVDVAPLEGAGHSWMLEDPSAAAGVLQRFWASLA